MEGKEKRGVIVQSVARALTMISCFANDTELGISEIAERMDLSKSTTYGLVNTLTAFGYLEQTENKKYRLGLKLFELGNLVQSRMDVRMEARPYCQLQADKYRPTVHLATQTEREIINNDKGGKKEIVHRHGVTKAEQGHFAKAGVTGKRFVREFKFENASEYELGQEIKADIFAAGDKIDATAISKGKGFQGAIKRHNQSRGPMAHGSKYHRQAGSNGACSDPSKVFKGKHMPGHMGSKKITVQNLVVVRVDAENNLLLVKGSVPGPKKSLVTIKEAVKAN